MINIGVRSLYNCRDEFIVSSEVQLRQMLVEFEDHRLITLRKHEQLGEAITVNVRAALLDAFFAEHGIALADE